MLPPLASSLAYSNYSNWQADHQGQQLPDVAPGVSIADLYKAAEREVSGMTVVPTSRLTRHVEPACSMHTERQSWHGGWWGCALAVGLIQRRCREEWPWQAVICQCIGTVKPVLEVITVDGISA